MQTTARGEKESYPTLLHHPPPLFWVRSSYAHRQADMEIQSYLSHPPPAELLSTPLWFYWATDSSSQPVLLRSALTWLLPAHLPLRSQLRQAWNCTLNMLHTAYRGLRHTHTHTHTTGGAVGKIEKIIRTHWRYDLFAWCIFISGLWRCKAIYTVGVTQYTLLVLQRLQKSTCVYFRWLHTVN